MKKSAIVTLVISTLFLFSFQCGKEQPIHNNNNIYKARFEIAAICFNYTFSVTGGNIDPDWVEKSWTDPNTTKTYTNAFAITNPCDLPQNLKAGDEFYFSIVKSIDQNCTVCLAHYPTPSKQLAIKVTQVIGK